MINGRQSEGRNEMYQKYKKSSIFTDIPLGNPGVITTKVNEKRYDTKFEPKYKEKNAREQFIKQFWQKDPQSVPLRKVNKTLNKSVYVKRQLNANEIMCRDMYSNCNPKEYQIRRSKSSFLKRSKGGCSASTIENTVRNGKVIGGDMSHKERFVDSLQSNIFFSPDEAFNRNKERTSVLPPERTDRNGILIYPQDSEDGAKSKIPNSRITHSKLTSNFDWKYVNTEISCERLSLNVNKSNGKSNGIGSHLKKPPAFTNHLTDGRQSFLDPNQKENFINLNSVQYDIITNQEGVPSKNGTQTVNGASTHRPPRKGTGSSFAAKQAKQSTHCLKETEEYQIDVPQGFDKINVKEIKNMFYSEGIHLYRCEAKGSSLSNGSGKIMFKVRKDGNDCQYATKIDNINSKIANSQMALNKTSRNSIRPITELVSVNEKILTGFKDTTIEKRLKRSQTPGSELKKANTHNSHTNTEHSKVNECNKANKTTNSSIQYDHKFKNQCIYTKTQEKAALSKA